VNRRPDNLRDVRSELQRLYQELEQEIVQAGPVCRMSGLCCRFTQYGHTLFVSGPEALLLVADAPPPVRDLDQGETCPWQDQNDRCTARDARPLGCRIFFCDPSFETRMPGLAETYIARLKQIASEHDWPWDYAPLHDHLRRARSEGRLNARTRTSEREPDRSNRSLLENSH
jgi:hypothetical protein